MFDYFRKCSSNDHQACCKDSPTKGLYEHRQSNDLDLHLRSQGRLKLDYFLTCNISTPPPPPPTTTTKKQQQQQQQQNLQYPGKYLSYYIQTWHDGKRMDAIQANVISMTLILV